MWVPRFLYKETFTTCSKRLNIWDSWDPFYFLSCSIVFLTFISIMNHIIRLNLLLRCYNNKMLQRSYLSTSQFDNLYAENSLLRDRVRKMSQIQPYVDLLLQNNKKYQEDIKEIQIQNNKLRGRVDAVLEESILIKQAHKNEINQLKGGFQSDIERLIRQLKDILRDKQAMQEANNSLIEELTAKCRKDIENKKRQLQQLQMDSNRKINKLSEVVRGKDKFIEEISEDFKYKQNILIEKNEELTYKISILQKDKQHLSKELEDLNDEKRNLIRKNKQLLKQNEDTSTKWLKSDQEKSEAMLSLKNKNIELGKRYEEIEERARVQEKIINQLNRKIAHLTKECDEILNLKNDIEANLRRNLRSYEQLKSDHAEVIIKLDTVSRTTESQLKRQGEELLRLSDDNKKLSRENIEVISDNKDKTNQIQDLIRALQKMERRNADLSQKNMGLQDDSAKRIIQNKSLQEKVEDLLLEKKSLNEKISLYMSHNSTLEQMLGKEKKKNICLETSRFQIQTIAMGALSKPEEICREYEKEIEKIVQQFVAEKQQIENMHQSQIMSIKSAYEQALKQKDQYFNRKIAFLEKQMVTLRTLR